MSRRWMHLAAAATLAGLAACKESTSPSSALFNETTVTNDVAASAGDALATTVNGMS